MASTAIKTVEEYQGATRPDRTPAPGVSRVLASAAPAAGFALMASPPAQPLPGPGSTLPVLALVSLALNGLRQRAARSPAIRIQDDHLIATALLPRAAATLSIQPGRASAHLEAEACRVSATTASAAGIR